MKRTTLGALIIAAAFPYTATAGENCVPFGRKLVCVGDNEAKVWDRAGQPDRTAGLENGYGAGMGERWFYYLNTRPKKVVALDISGGQVVAITESR